VKEEGEEETQKSRMKRKKNNWLIILAQKNSRMLEIKLRLLSVRWESRSLSSTINDNLRNWWQT
jgi:hypothetical protein